MCGAPACLTHSPPIAGRKFKAVFGVDAQQGRALLNWGRVLMLRAELAAQEPQVPHCCLMHAQFRGKSSPRRCKAVVPTLEG